VSSALKLANLWLAAICSFGAGGGVKQLNWKKITKRSYQMVFFLAFRNR
jgi:hypothetical protein